MAERGGVDYYLNPAEPHVLRSQLTCESSLGQLPLELGSGSMT